jgi:hypothetical protein
MSKGIAAIVVACLMALAGCGSSGSASTTTAVPATTAAPSSTAATTTTLNVKAVGQKVLAIINSGNAAIDRDKKISGQSTEFKAVSGDFSSAAQQLQALTYPPDAAADAKALVAILNKLAFDASQAATASATSLNSLLTVIETDEGTEVADSDSLRHDLGLPPASA